MHVLLWSSGSDDLRQRSYGYTHTYADAHRQAQKHMHLHRRSFRLLVAYTFKYIYAHMNTHRQMHTCIDGDRRVRTHGDLYILFSLGV